MTVAGLKSDGSVLLTVTMGRFAQNIARGRFIRESNHVLRAADALVEGVSAISLLHCAFVAFNGWKRS